MKKKILIAPNSYKECADSVSAANYFAQELNELNAVENILLPLSDGGDGFLNVCSKYYKLEILEYEISTPYNETTFSCKVGYDREKGVIFIESANVLGMKIIPQEKRHPMYLSSKGMGELLHGIMKDHENNKVMVKKIIIGIGGTGTNDLGLGLLESFGLRLKGEGGRILKVIPANYEIASEIIWSNQILPFEIELVSDVDNPLLGDDGSTMVFGKQKGLSNEELISAENGFCNIVNLLKYHNIVELPNALPGSGGGLSAGLKLFFNAKLKSSKIFLSEILKSINIKDIDLIITGEGAFDNQSFNQKATGFLIDIYQKCKKPIIVCCGTYNENISGNLPENVFVIELKKYFKNESDSIKYFRKGIHFAVNEIAERFI